MSLRLVRRADQLTAWAVRMDIPFTLDGVYYRAGFLVSVAGTRIAFASEVALRRRFTRERRTPRHGQSVETVAS